MANLKEFLGSTGLGALWARITEELNKKATSADLADVATSGSYNDLEDKPFIPSAVSDLTDDSGHYTKPANGIPASDLEETYLTSFTETDPTVPSWAKAPQKPSYTANEVGALPDNTFIPSKVSDLTNDAGYLTQHQDISGKANISDLSEVATSGDYNDLINTPTNVSEFNNDAGYLTQHQDISGKADKSEIPTLVSELTNDVGYITGYTEIDPTVPAWAKASTKPSYTAAEVGAPTVAEMNSAIGNAIGNVHQFEVEIVQELPVENIKEHTVYFVPKSGATDDVYDEYVYIDNAWEMIGNTQIDLSNYATKSEIPSVPVQDVQVNGTSILSNGTANIPIATSSGEYGAVAINTNYGIASYNNNGTLMVMPASSEQIKTATNSFRPIVSPHQHESVFYGLAKAAGDTTQAQSNNAVGTYTEEAKIAILNMFGLQLATDTEVQNIINGGVGA